MMKRLNRRSIVLNVIVASTIILSPAVHAQSLMFMDANCNVRKGVCTWYGTDSAGMPITNWVAYWTAGPGPTANNLDYGQNKSVRKKSTTIRGKKSNAPYSDQIPCDMEKGNGVVFHVNALDDLKPTGPGAVVWVSCW